MPNHRLRWTRHDTQALGAGSEIAKQWDRLNADRGDLPFLGTEAVACALKAFGTGRERLFCAHEGGRAVAIFLLVPDGLRRWRTFQPSQLPLGSWVAEAGLSIQFLSRSLLDGPLRFCLALSITQVDPLVAPRSSDTPITTHSDYIETGWVDIEGDFDDYWNARGKNLRQNLRKQHKKLDTDGVALAFRELREVKDMAPALERYGRLESTGWKGNLGTAIHPDNQQGIFYRMLFEQAAARGEAVIYECLFGDTVVAMNLCLLRQQQLIVLKTAYDESIKYYSPAFLLREHELQVFFGQKLVKRVEYFGRLMEWHTRLTNNKRVLYHLTAYRYSWIKKFNEYRNKRAASAEKSVSVPENDDSGADAPDGKMAPSA